MSIPLSGTRVGSTKLVGMTGGHNKLAEVGCYAFVDHAKKRESGNEDEMKEMKI